MIAMRSVSVPVGSFVSACYPNSLSYGIDAFYAEKSSNLLEHELGQAEDAPQYLS
jgi:hypothetical protein